MTATSDATTNNLASLVVLLQKLYEQLRTDRGQWASTGQDMATLIATLQSHLQTFQELQPQFKAQVTTLIRDESQHAAHTVATSLQNSLNHIMTQNLNPIVQPLAQAAGEAQHQLQEQRQTLQYYFWWFILGIIVSSSLGGLIVRYGLQPQFSDYERQLMYQGSVLTIARQASTQEERDKILELYLGKRLAPSSSQLQPESSSKVKAKTRALPQS